MSSSNAIFPTPADDLSSLEEIDPCNIYDAFVETCSSIQTIGPCRRLKFAFVERSRSGASLVVMQRLVMPADAMIDLARRILAHERDGDVAGVAMPLNASTH